MSRGVSAATSAVELKHPRRVTVAHVVRDLLRFIKEIKCKPALLRSTDPSFILDRVRDLCHPNFRKEVSLGSLPDELLSNCLRYLGPEDMLAMGKVCSNFHRLTTVSDHWKELLPLEFPVPMKANFDYRSCYLRMKKKPNNINATHPSILLEGLHASFIGSNPVVDGILIKANNPIHFTSLSYFEVRIESTQNSKISLGFISEGYPQMHPGFYPMSYAYHSDSGSLFNNSDERNWGPAFDDGDYIGCGFHPGSSSLFFTKNSELLGMPFPVDTTSEELLFPAIGLQAPGQSVYIELGADPEAFVFPIHELDAMPPAILRRFDSYSDLDYGSDYVESESESLPHPDIEPDSSYASSEFPAESESYQHSSSELYTRQEDFSDSSYQDQSSDFSEHVTSPPTTFYSHHHSPPSLDLQDDLEQLLERLLFEGRSESSPLIDFIRSHLRR